MPQDDEKTLLIKEITAELSDKSCDELILNKIFAETILRTTEQEKEFVSIFETTCDE